jgi:hypothetical protein
MNTKTDGRIPIGMCGQHMAAICFHSWVVSRHTATVLQLRREFTSRTFWDSGAVHGMGHLVRLSLNKETKNLLISWEQDMGDNIATKWETYSNFQERLGREICLLVFLTWFTSFFLYVIFRLIMFKFLCNSCNVAHSWTPTLFQIYHTTSYLSHSQISHSGEICLEWNFHLLHLERFHFLKPQVNLCFSHGGFLYPGFSSSKVPGHLSFTRLY